jgi:hypothetical protein
MALCCVLPCTCERNSIQIVLEFAAQLLVYLVYLKAQEGRDPDHDWDHDRVPEMFFMLKDLKAPAARSSPYLLLAWRSDSTN